MPRPIFPEQDAIGTVRRKLVAQAVKVFAGHLDIRDGQVSIAGFIAAAEAACGPAGILVNAAGTTAEQPVCGHSDELWHKIIDTNLTGAFRMIRAPSCRA